MRSVLIILLLAGASLYSCSSEDAKSGKRLDSENLKLRSEVATGPVLEFASLEHDFGTVREGEKVGWYFTYKNSGDGDLLIRAANASCGCTVPEFSKEPLPPDGEGMIKIVFDTSGRLGKQTKMISIESNDKNPVIQLKVMAEVISK